MSLLEACLVVPRGRHGDGHHLIRLQVLLDAACGATLHIAHKCSAGNISMTPSLALYHNSWCCQSMSKYVEISQFPPAIPPPHHNSKQLALLCQVAGSGTNIELHLRQTRTELQRNYGISHIPNSKICDIQRLVWHFSTGKCELPAPEHPHVNLAFPSVKVTPDSQSTPASATISPAPAFHTTKSYKIRVKNGHNMS